MTEYRVAGHWSGRWQETEWYEELDDAIEKYRDIRDGNWMQLGLERKQDGEISTVNPKALEL